ncbi:MAG: hypothetical protein A3F83_03780 [Candidatus Glassbacteria bacterium RIFCSPLOWO2_12_FULL_58_11]|uniref:B3/B4 tRNA-binding domain-containing protein n=1 Tax=Candidatus Glassbacteria bacterium RIFCSPLOWO2_12_FULL_58_11 TaxID=1817867 RepID=A0A1F5YWR4_9BACT|nr:MAG: hypothetical protein A3F83_03780 [Candidatus Glassbacteria bacterium RIFCSPLOWO2_12_FULL_58_11]
MAQDPIIEIDPELKGKIRLVAVTAGGLSIDAGENLWRVFQPFCSELASRHDGLSLGEVPGIQAARQFYRAIGVDPTRVRPSSEALLKRVLKGRELYRINSLVDTLNYCSLSFMLPVGLYDLERITGDTIRLRKGAAGESFEGIRKDRVNLEGRYALFDEEGPFGSPTADSERTSITCRTRCALTVIFAPSGIPPEELEEQARFTAAQIERFGGGNPHTRMGRTIG